MGTERKVPWRMFQGGIGIFFINFRDELEFGFVLFHGVEREMMVKCIR